MRLWVAFDSVKSPAAPATFQFGSIARNPAAAGLIQAQRARLETQRQKLSVGAFAGGVEAYRDEVTRAVAELRLEQIVLLPLESLGRNGKEMG